MRALRSAVLAATVGALLWCGWVFLQRYNARRAWQAEQPERAANQAAAEQFNRVYGGSQVKILNFYAGSGMAAAAGQPRLLCYSVLNARELRLDPPVADVYPTLSKCVEVRPEKETR